MFWIHFGRDNDDQVFCAKFPQTEFSIRWSKRIMRNGGYNKIAEVKYRYFTYEEKHDWDFKKELEKIFYDKSVDEIERISELLQVIGYFNKYDILEERFHNSQEENYEAILQNLVREIFEEDNDNMIPERLL